MTSMASESVEGMRQPALRGPSAKGWLLIVALSVAGLVAVLIGVVLLAQPGDPCSCSPIPPSRSASAPASAEQ
jgi:hypothetical protein